MVSVAFRFAVLVATMNNGQVATLLTSKAIAPLVDLLDTKSMNPVAGGLLGKATQPSHQNVLF